MGVIKMNDKIIDVVRVVGDYCLCNQIDFKFNVLQDKPVEMAEFVFDKVDKRLVIRYSMDSIKMLYNSTGFSDSLITDVEKAMNEMKPLNIKWGFR